MNRLDLLQKLDDLNERMEKADDAERVELEKEYEEIGKLLLVNPRRMQKIEMLKKKGKDTFSEVEWLNEQGLTKRQIAKFMGIGRGDLYVYLESHAEKLNKTEVFKMPRLQMTVEEYRGFKAQGLNDEKVAKEKGVSVPTLTNWKKKYLSPNDAPAPQAKPVKQEEMVPKSKYDQLQAKHETLLTELQDYKGRHKRRGNIIADLEKQISELNDRLSQPAEPIEDWKDKYITESKAHTLLLQYIGLTRVEVNQ